MLDEWIEQRSRFRTQAPAALPQPSPPPRRFLTTTGELIPLTESVIEEIQLIVNEYLRGETPPDYVPQVETAGGQLEPITPESFEELIAVIRQDAAHRSTTNQILKENAPVPVQPHPRELEWFDTHDGGLPPVTVETTPGNGRRARRRHDEVVDAEWVVEVGEQRARRGRRRARQAGRPAWLLRGALVIGLLAVLGFGAAIALGYIEISLPPVPASARSPEPQAVEADAEAPAAAPGDPAAAAPTGEAPTPDTELPAALAAPQPDGRIAFASDEDGDFEIYVLDVVSGAITQLTDNDAADRSPTWSPDGSRIVYVSDQSGDDDLYAVEASGGEPVRLTTSDEHDRTPAWSPDGTRVMFARESANGSDLMAFNVGCMDEAEACEDTLQTIVGGGYDREPAWAADGQTVALSTAAFPGLPSAVGLLKPDEDAVRPLAGTGLTDFSPAWSPDGRWIMFVSNRDGDYDLWAMEPDGGAPVQVTRGATVEVQPKWAPGGEFVVFASDRRTGTDFDLYVLAAACLEGNPQTCEDSVIALTDGPADALDPAWVR